MVLGAGRVADRGRGRQARGAAAAAPDQVSEEHHPPHRAGRGQRLTPGRQAGQVHHRCLGCAGRRSIHVVALNPNIGSLAWPSLR